MIRQHAFQKYWPQALALAVALLAATLAVLYAGQPLLERFDQRQTHTALTSLWMLKEGLRVDYLTPILGYPWTIPFEFPIYNGLVAIIAKAGDFPLDNTGRLVSFCFLIASGFPAYQIARRLGLSTQTFWIFYALLLSSPVYLFWGRSFLIETASFFFTLMFMPYALDMRLPKSRWQSMALFAFFASLAALQKMPAATPAIIVMGMVVFIAQVNNGNISPARWRFTLSLAAAFATPLAIGILWTLYSDILKAQSAYGAEITFEDFREFHFGTLEQRLNFGVWKITFYRALVNIGSWPGFIVLGIAATFAPRTVRMILLTCLALFVLPILIFLNLHHMHDYYMVEMLGFLIGALAIAITWLSQRIQRPYLAPILAVFVIVLNLGFFSKLYFPLMTTQFDSLNSNTLAVASVLKKYTPPDSAVVIYGNDWNSNIAYYAARKTFSPANYKLFSYGRQKGYHFKSYPLAWEHPEQFVGDQKIGAVVFCPSVELNIDKITGHPLIKKDPSFFTVKQCYVQLPGIKSITLDGSADTVSPGFIFDKVLHEPPAGYTKTTKIQCRAAIDDINGPYIRPTLSENKVKNELLVRGQTQADPPSFLILEGEDGARGYIPLHIDKRNNPVVRSRPVNGPGERVLIPGAAAFTALIDARSLKGKYHLSLAHGYHGVLGICKNTKVTVTIGAEQ